ncbi:hypothetical protein RMATCC62417_02075 [Rhizopus microsporus]|nr:hypothetical protein RMATCC62417_02075 [Rhizopus microsporus]
MLHVLSQQDIEQTKKSQDKSCFDTQATFQQTYFLGQNKNNILDEGYYYDMSNFEIANRAFYATINKFSRQNCPDTPFTKKKSSPYSFLENWHLHSIYSKSQQTLLGIHPVKPSVILCGDDFMFTPPFIPQQEEWNVVEPIEDVMLPPVNQKEYSSAMDGTPSLFYMPSDQSQEIVVFDNDPFDVYTEDYYHSSTTTGDDEYEDDTMNNEQVLISSSSDSSSIVSSISIITESDGDHKRRSFYGNDDDDGELSSYDLMNLYDAAFDFEDTNTASVITTQPVPVTRSSSFLSQNSFLSAKSAMSYQSLADIIVTNSGNSYSSSFTNYGTATTHLNEDSIENLADNSLLTRLYLFIINFWSLIMSYIYKVADDKSPLLPK